jgi:hypothetical protein
MVKVNSTFDKLEEGIFDTSIATSPHVGHTSESAPASSQPQYERPFYYYFDQHGRVIAKSQSKLASSAHETDRANSGGTTTIHHSKRPITSKSSAMSMKKEAILSKSIISQKTSLATEKTWETPEISQT